MYFRQITFIAVLLGANLLTAFNTLADSPDAWMVVPESKVLSLESAKPGPIDQSLARPLWGSPWIHVDGLLRGSPSPPEVQAAKPNHNGANPRLIFTKTPDEYFAEFSIRFIGGEDENDKGLPLIDLGHHISALTLGGDKGLRLTINRHSSLVAHDKTFRLDDGKTYEFIIEVKGAETLVRIKDGPTLYATNDFLFGQKRTIGLAGAMQGTIEIDEFSIWTVKDDFQSDWEERRKTLSSMESIQLTDPPSKKSKNKRRNPASGAIK